VTGYEKSSLIVARKHALQNERKSQQTPVLGSQIHARTHLLVELSIGYGLASELDVDGIGARVLRRVHNADGAIAIVDDGDVDVGVSAAADAAGDVADASLRSVDVDDALLANRDRRTDALWWEECQLGYTSCCYAVFIG